MSRTKTVTNAAPILAADPARIQSLVDRRLAMRLGMSLPLAATVAALAGLGPRTERVGR